MNPIEPFRKIYGLRLQKYGRRIPRVEEYLSFGADVVPSEDYRRNEATFFAKIAKNEGAVLRECLNVLFDELRRVSYDQAAEIIDAVAFVQWIVADVMWRFNHKVARELETFTRDFDRLDIEDERLRLYRLVKDGEWGM